MFETVAPEAFQRRHRRLYYQVLPVSIAIHAIVVAAALAGTVWTVVFPIDSPRQVRAYSLMEIPAPPPPPPPPPAAPAPRPQVAPPPQPLPIEKIVAPTIIPETIPIVPQDPAPADPVPAAPDPGPAATDGEPGGVPGGVAGGIPQGVPGSVPFPDDGRMHVERGKNLPMETVSQEFPHYPSDAIKLQLEDQVVIRYIIGKNGRVNDVQILSHANLASFDNSVLEAVKQWRFRPMIKDGKPVEVTHDLAINFMLLRH